MSQPSDLEATFASRVVRAADPDYDTREGPYLNLIGDEGGDRVREAFGPEKYARLQKPKDEYDPDNLFGLNQNIPPSGG
jgi:hypothetical protein